MNPQTTDEQLLLSFAAILKEVLRIDPAKIRPELRLFDDLGAESLDLLDIRFRIERMWGFKIAQDEIIQTLGRSITAAEIREKLTVRSIMDFIKSRLLSKEMHHE